MSDPDAPETEPGGVRLLPPRPPGAPPGTGAGDPDDPNAGRRSGRRWLLLGLALELAGATLVLLNLLAAEGAWRVLGLIGLGLILTFMLAAILLAALRRDLAGAARPAALFGCALLFGVVFLLLGMWAGPNPLKPHGAAGLACLALAVPVLRAGFRRLRPAGRRDAPLDDEEPV